MLRFSGAHCWILLLSFLLRMMESHTVVRKSCRVFVYHARTWKTPRFQILIWFFTWMDPRPGRWMCLIAFGIHHLLWFWSAGKWEITFKLLSTNSGNFCTNQSLLSCPGKNCHYLHWLMLCLWHCAWLWHPLVRTWLPNIFRDYSEKWQTNWKSTKSHLSTLCYCCNQVWCSNRRFWWCF